MKRFFTFLSILLCVFTVSCKYELISEPTINTDSNKNPADYDDYISPPKNVKTSHGDSRKITISWDALPNAVNYYVFSAPTPFDEFQQIGETTTTSFIVEEAPGITKYYAVKAVNYYSTASFLSEKCSASTLAKPIITKIENDIDSEGNTTGKSVTVSWWMDNCDEFTYKQDVSFVVTTYLDNNKTKIPGIEPIILDSSEYSTTIKGLSPNTDYYFLVQVINNNPKYPDATESSDLTNKATAHFVYPEAPENFIAEQGISEDEISLTWELPMYADYYDSKLEYYEEHPVYFKLYRRMCNEDTPATEDDYIEIARYIGINTENTNNRGYWFNCSDGSTSDPILSIKDTSKYTDLTSAQYPAYIPFYELTFKDKTALQDQKYEYKLQAFTDYTSSNSKTPSSELTYTTGWKLPKANFSLLSTISTNEDKTKITEIKVDFNFDFQSFGKNYTYQIETSRLNLINNEPISTEELIKSSDIEAIKNFSVIFSDDVTQEDKGHYKILNNDGYYTFKLNILESETLLASKEASGIVTVTDDATLIPNIKNFEIKDGYKDRFVISWDYSEIGKKNGKDEENCLYTLSWVALDKEDKAIESGTYDIDLTSAALTDDTGNNTITFAHEAKSGDRRRYSLSVNTGLSATATSDIIYETLGTAVPVVAAADYSTIKVSWEEVQKADKYTISAFYKDGDKSELVNSDGETKNIEISTNIIEGKTINTCVLSKPKGYDDAAISGKEISFNIISSNSLPNNETTACASTYTMGPALINSAKENAMANDIEIKWNAYEDVDGYIVYRFIYGDKSCSSILPNSQSIYYIDNNLQISSINLLESGTYDPDKNDGRVTITLDDNIIRLCDTQKDADEETSYQLSQSKIKWGLPYGYLVLPVRKGGSINDFIIAENNEISMNSIENQVIYKNPNITKNSTFGYGLNVQASKATSASEVKLKWDSPNENTKDHTPYIFRRNMYKKNRYDKWVLDTDASWELVQDVKLSTGAIDCTIKIKPEDWAKPYEYAVQYGANSPNGLVKSYKDLLKNTKEDASLYKAGVTPEERNKGYVLALGNFEAAYAGGQTEAGNPAYYQEALKWEDWSYETRTLGPDKYTFAIKNKNLSSTANWADLFTFNKDENNKYNLDTSDSAHIVYDETTNTTANTAYADTTVVLSNSVNNISLDPTGLTCGEKTNTDGLLKVLRDAKHYYSVKLTRGDSISVIQAEDEAVYAYRQISDEELAKCVSLIIADALYQASIPESGISSWQDSFCNGYQSKGAMQIGHEAWSNKVRWGTNNVDYIHQFISGGNSVSQKPIISDFIINCPLTEGNVGAKGHVLYNLPPHKIKIKHNCPDNQKLSSFDSEITFKAGIIGKSIINTDTEKIEFTLKILNKDGKEIISINNNKNNFLKWFPYEIGKKESSRIIDPNTTLPLYQSPWWN